MGWDEIYPGGSEYNFASRNFIIRNLVIYNLNKRKSQSSN